MPHGTPDWGLVGPKQTVFGLDDLAEHAARLGSPHLWDRRGDVIWLTDFSEGIDGISWYDNALLPLQTLFAGYSRQGAYSVKVECGPAAGEYCGFNKHFPMPIFSRMGVEFSWSMDQHVESVTVMILLRNAASSYQGGLRYVLGTPGMEYFVTAGVWTPMLPGINLQWAPGRLHTMKLVVDYAAVDAAGNPAPEHVRAIVDDTEWPLAGLLLDTALGGGPLYGFARIFVRNDTGERVALYVDNVIITQNEP